MLPFKLENLSKVDRVVFRVEKVDSLIDRSSNKRIRLHASLYAGDRQMSLGASVQKSRGMSDGEFSTDLSGKKLILMYQEAITGAAFEEASGSINDKLWEFRRK